MLDDHKDEHKEEQKESAVKDIHKDYIDKTDGESWEDKIEKHAILEVTLGKLSEF